METEKQSVAYTEQRLFRELKSGKTRAIKRVSTRNTDPRDKNGLTILHKAARKGQTVLVRNLLSSGNYHNLNTTDRYGWTALHWAAWSGHSSVVHTLVLNGWCNINAMDKTGANALHLAALQGHVDVVGELISGKCDINLKRKMGNTALHEAVKECNLSIVETLLNNNCRVNIHNYLGQSPMDIAKLHGFYDMVVLLAGLKSLVDVDIPTVVCKSGEELKTLLLRVDANCTIRSADHKKRFQGHNKDQQRDQLLSQLWKDKLKIASSGVVSNCEARVSEIEDRYKEKLHNIEYQCMTPRHCTNMSSRIPSAPLERKIMSHNLSLLSL